ncbi:MAG: glycosyltransferase family 39 protein, partial [Verrucomicrobiota bacterium]|nr:glycosyltransferase family 39 protein [Verrucomicrobiota bacterium]
VPQVGSDPYFRKPPLVNWLVAGSFKLFGQRSEWAARFPSTLCVLAVALALVTVARQALGASGSLIAAIVWLTNFGMLEKGRLIEIEALYVSLCGLAFIGWFSWWLGRRSSWLTWTFPWVFLGLGLLAKGPLLLVFFYVIVVAVLYRTRELRSLINLPHLLGLGLMLAIFAAWAVPCFLAMRESGVAHAWSRQLSGRFSGEDFKLASWLMNMPRGLGYLLPWTPILLFVNRVTHCEARTSAAAKGLLWGIAVSFVGVSLLPGALPRYTMPLLVPAAALIAMLLTADENPLPTWMRSPWPRTLPADSRLPAIVTAAVCLFMLIYAFALMPTLRKREKVRNIAAQINAALPTNEPLFAVNPDYQPFLFYVRDPIVYVGRTADLPVGAKYILVQPQGEKEVIGSSRWQPLAARPILRLKDYRNKEVILLRVGAR